MEAEILDATPIAMLTVGALKKVLDERIGKLTDTNPDMPPTMHLEAVRRHLLDRGYHCKDLSYWRNAEQS